MPNNKGKTMRFNIEDFKKGMPATTRDGRNAAFIGICEQCGEDYQLAAHVEGRLNVTEYFLDGKFKKEFGHELDLISMYHPAQDWPVDTKVWCWGEGKHCKVARHFAKYENGKLYAYEGGRSSFTSEGLTSRWDNMELAE